MTNDLRISGFWSTVLGMVLASLATGAIVTSLIAFSRVEILTVASIAAVKAIDDIRADQRTHQAQLTELLIKQARSDALLERIRDTKGGSNVDPKRAAGTGG